MRNGLTPPTTGREQRCLGREWVSDFCLKPTQQFVSYIMIRTSYFQWSDEEVRFVLDLHTDLDLYGDSSLEQQSADRYVAPSDTFSWFRANLSLFFLFNPGRLTQKQQIPIS